MAKISNICVTYLSRFNVRRTVQTEENALNNCYSLVGQSTMHGLFCLIGPACDAMRRKWSFCCGGNTRLCWSGELWVALFTLFILLKLLYTAWTVACMLINIVSKLLEWADAYWAKCWIAGNLCWKSKGSVIGILSDKFVQQHLSTKRKCPFGAPLYGKLY